MIYTDIHRYADNIQLSEYQTRGSAIAEEPRDALRQLKYHGRFYRASYASTVLAVIVCLSVYPSVSHKSELYKNG